MRNTFENGEENMRLRPSWAPAIFVYLLQHAVKDELKPHAQPTARLLPGAHGVRVVSGLWTPVPAPGRRRHRFHLSGVRTAPESHHGIERRGTFLQLKSGERNFPSLSQDRAN